MSEEKILFHAQNVSKSFGITKALVNVGITLKRGQILGLVGENGSGKSTLSSIIGGMQMADSGEMFLNGRRYAPRTSVEAAALGVCMILQEKGTFADLSVAKNIFIGCEKQFRSGALVNNRKMDQAAALALQKINAGHISPSELAGRLSFEDRKLVELARAVRAEPDILIVDETTTALSRKGRDMLYAIIHKMRDDGKGIIFISHDIDELMEQCDALQVLRDGHFIATLERDGFDAEKIKSLMIGRKPMDKYFRTDTHSCHNDEVVLAVRGVTTERLKNVSFDLHRGEILGIGGLADCGMHDIGRVVFGLTPVQSGSVSMANGAQITSPRRAMSNRMAYMSKNRDQESLMTAASIRENIALPSYDALRSGVFVRPAKERAFVEQMCSRFNVKMQSQNQFAQELSGGNKQKVVIAKWLGFGADTLILDCPTRGIDIGVKASIYDLMSQLRDQGKSMILISEELSELIGMSDRILLMRDGRINGEVLREDNPSERQLIDQMV